MGWSQGTKGITVLSHSTGVDVDIVKAYGQINEATLKTHCDVFCRSGGAQFQSCVAQNNHMMAQCLKIHLPLPHSLALSPTKINTLSMASSTDH
jgi:hypothetical protein